MPIEVSVVKVHTFLTYSVTEMFSCTLHMPHTVAFKPVSGS